MRELNHGHGPMHPDEHLASTTRVRWTVGRNTFVQLGLALLAGVGLAACGGLTGTGEEAPGVRLPVDNVLLVSIDSLRSDHLGAYGYPQPTSPTVDALARRGVVFERAYSTTSWTLPSHVALFTGLEDPAHGVVFDDRRLADTVPTLAAMLANHGIRTTGFFSGPYLHPAYGLARGFDEWIDSTSYRSSRKEEPTVEEMLASHKDVTNPILLEEIGRWAARGLSPSGNFIFIHMWDVHYDYIAPERYVEMFDPEYDGPVTGEDYLANETLGPDLPPRDLAHLLALYDAEIRYTDDTLGRIFERLAAAGLSKETAVIVLSDHGQEFFEHGGRGHRQHLYEEVLRVPFILSLPGEDAPSARIERLVSLIDVMPTVCELFGIECAAASPGRSLLSSLRAAHPGRGRRVLAELTVPSFGAHLVALVSREGKVIRDLGSGGDRYIPPREPGDPFREHLLRGPGSDAPPAAARLLRDLSARVAAARRTYRRFHAEGETPQAEIDEATRERLRSLGYVR